MSDLLDESVVDVLADPWDASGTVRMDGWLERRAISPTAMAFVALIGAFILFQVIVSPLAVVALLMAQGVDASALLGDVDRIIAEHAASLLTANSIGQVLGLAIPAYLLARMHTGRPMAFLRMRRTDAVFIVLAVVGLLAITPAIQWLGAVNEQLPLPDYIRRFEQSQIELIERVLNVDTGLLFNVFVLALTPALCEEVLFRGYVQRQAERGMGAAAGILFSGMVFGAYHLRFSQILPLCVLGIFLAYLVWRTGSLWPAIVVHFANNAMAVAMGAYISRRPELELADIEQL
ncbi:MAG: CPBP family intramembrane glutamic endopeptidase, partial [Rhodothermales bacterium]